MTMIPTETNHNNEGKVAGVALPPGLAIKINDGAQPQRINEGGEAQESHGDGWGIETRNAKNGETPAC